MNRGKEGNPLHKSEFSLGDRLRLVRMGSGLSVKEMAERLGVQPATVYGKENGHDSVIEHYTVKYEETLGIKKGTIIQDSCSLDGSDTTNDYQMFFHTEKPKNRVGFNGITAEIRNRILQGVYQNKIPSARELAQEFGYSRAWISYALKRLRTEGLTEGCSKRGTLITK